ncbi:hypothetical protein [Salipiger mucosus]|uniref:Uncharacterized protein n=1 Tax=Salipiger mucosus DSM 16094 TaxID=1123237 RepID=S9RVS7_9RHOB|nr:hypothetical protein [Salipiger mucosus]EPX78084.1 hypothetical protein Salmuc_03406 [Salipiger mucosus DSM 16094]
MTRRIEHKLAQMADAIRACMLDCVRKLDVVLGLDRAWQKRGFAYEIQTPGGEVMS